MTGADAILWGDGGMRKLVIFGTGPYAAAVRDCIDPARFTAIGYIDDLAEKGKEVDRLPVLGGAADLPQLLARHPLMAGVVAIEANHVRRMIVEDAERQCPAFEWAAIVHLAATVSPRAEVGPGSVVEAGAVIGAHARAGRHVIVGAGGVIGHDSLLADYCSTGPGVATGGSVRIGLCSHVGIGASVRHGVAIGDFSVIGGQSFVNRAIGDRRVAHGVPATEARERSPDSAYL